MSYKRWQPVIININTLSSLDPNWIDLMHLIVLILFLSNRLDIFNFKLVSLGFIFINVPPYPDLLSNYFAYICF